MLRPITDTLRSYFRTGRALGFGVWALVWALTAAILRAIWCALWPPIPAVPTSPPSAGSIVSTQDPPAGEEPTVALLALRAQVNAGWRSEWPANAQATVESQQAPELTHAIVPWQQSAHDILRGAYALLASDPKEDTP